LAALAAEGLRRPLLSLMLANNETGVVQPVAEAAAAMHAAGGLLHVDAGQGPGRIPCNINELGAHLLPVSGHKGGGAPGTGALVKRVREGHFGDPLVKGGGQERGARGGTENVAGIAGFGAAVLAARTGLEEESGRVAGLRNQLELGLRQRTPDVVIFGAGAR